MRDASLCLGCPVDDKSFCGAVLSHRWSSDEQSGNWQYFRTFPAGEQVCSPERPLPDIFVLCSGWAFRFLRISDGRRQILNFLLPGDLFSASAIFEQVCHSSVKALTTIQVSAMKRAVVQSRLAAHPAIVASLARSFSAEVRMSDGMIVALGRCPAEQRIAFLLLHLMKRIAARNVIRDQRFPLPLRQQHIADAVGLTSVHVCRVLRGFHDRRIADLSDGVLEVMDQRQLEQLGSLL